ncbi:hypothetical protein [Alteromonas halophila]|uniref:Uncharacterized protein n=1 Tax=Alteromonas halophila TaxID=516698 RepID=A0A918JLK9_9ALTE|nr:hypothetical protein [Alteromonas halophila]GGW88215.1 hypothetical protein GCM10007391_22550 [Alteromonas halophila]
MSKVNKEQIIEEFTQAYQKAHGKKPEIEAKAGWYSVDGGKNVRISQLEEMTAELNGGASSASKAPKAESAPKKPAKKTAAKAPAKKSKKASGGFSVKDFYAKQLEDEKPGSIRPR